MEKNTHFLYPASIFVSDKPYLINTILGSCVAVCLWDPILRIGGMNHYMLPFWNGQGLASPKYGNIAIERLISKMQNFGSNKNNLKAKVFGGAEVISNSASQFHIGERNVLLARQMLEEERIPIISSSMGGGIGRRIIFNNETGEVMQRFIGNQMSNG
jgi:chemotaxis protein CheD